MKLKNLVIIHFVIAFVAFTGLAYGYDLYFADNPQVQGDRVGYRLAPGTPQQTDIFQDNPNLTIIEENFQGTGRDIFRFRTNSVALVVRAQHENMTEFIGMSYVDMLVRLATGDSNYTWAQLRRLIRCQWQRNDETWSSGTVADYEADTEATGVVYFTPALRILGE